MHWLIEEKAQLFHSKSRFWIEESHWVTSILKNPDDILTSHLREGTDVTESIFLKILKISYALFGINKSFKVWYKNPCLDLIERNCCFQNTKCYSCMLKVNKVEFFWKLYKNHGGHLETHKTSRIIQNCI